MNYEGRGNGPVLRSDDVHGYLPTGKVPMSPSEASAPSFPEKDSVRGDAT